MMRVLVVAALEASSHFAHAINSIKMAEGFARLGHEVTLVCRRPAKGAIPVEELNAQYGIQAGIRWIQLPRRIFGIPLGEHWKFAIVAWRAVRKWNPEFVYARNYIFPWLSSRLGVPTVAESHAHPGQRNRFLTQLVKGSRHRAFLRWVTISERLAQGFQEAGVPREKLLVLPDAVDLELFRRPDPLPASPYQGNSPMVTYCGHLYDYKGIPTILEAAALLPEVQFHFVGGWEADIARQKSASERLRLSNVVFHGLKPHAEVAPFLWHADVLLLPPSANHPSAAWTSPVKLGEYLAAKTPVVATRIPALADWLSDQEVCFIKPDDGADMAKAIQRILADRDYGSNLVEKGYRKAAGWSYSRRAQIIIDSLSRNSAERSE